MNPPSVSLRRLLTLALVVAGCQGKSEPDQPRSPPAVIEARTGATTIAHIIAGHPCRAEIEGDELLVGTMPLVAQVGNNRWSGDDAGDGAMTLRRDGAAIVRIRDTQDAAIEVFDPRGGAILRLGADGAIANGAGEVLRRAEATRGSIKIGDALVTGTTDVALGVLITAPELIPEVRGLAACHRLFWHEQQRGGDPAGSAHGEGRSPSGSPRK
jgi:hypothetical protein